MKTLASDTTLDAERVQIQLWRAMSAWRKLELVAQMNADAEFFVTGDKDFTQAEKLIHTTILSVLLFKKLVCDISV